MIEVDPEATDWVWQSDRLSWRFARKCPLVNLKRKGIGRMVPHAFFIQDYENFVYLQHRFWEMYTFD